MSEYEFQYVEDTDNIGAFKFINRVDDSEDENATLILAKTEKGHALAIVALKHNHEDEHAHEEDMLVEVYNDDLESITAKLREAFVELAKSICPSNYEHNKKMFHMMLEDVLDEDIIEEEFDLENVLMH